MTDYASMLAGTIHAHLLADVAGAKVYTALVIRNCGDVRIVTEEIGTPCYEDVELGFVITDIDPAALLAALSEGGKASVLIDRIKAGYGESDSFGTYLTDDAGEAKIELMELLHHLSRRAGLEG
jgi:hypothetical protein